RTCPPRSPPSRRSSVSEPWRSPLARAGLAGEAERAVRDVDPRGAALGELPEQELVGELVLQLGLDHARERARAEQRIEALLGQPLARRGRQLDRDLLLGELRLDLDDELLHHAQHHLGAELLELHDLVEAVAEL